jgi:DNA repair protein RadD
VTVDVVSEGFDIPAASCAILLRPTKSLGLYLQQVGRVLRPAPGKQHAIILDHVGNVSRHGFPDDHREWSLTDGVRTRSVQAAPSVRTCPACFAAFKPAPICPCCGHEQPAVKTRPLRQVAGELQELRRESVRQRIEERQHGRREQGKARSLEQLLALAKQRGYSPGWAYRIYHARGQR